MSDDDNLDMKEPLLKKMNPNHMNNNLNSNASEHQRIISPFEPRVENNNQEKIYPKNIIISSRYTLINFFPKSLLEQFRRLANVYFLVLGIIAATGEYTSYYETAIEPAGILAPMCIVVMISVIKDGIEDMKRHSADSRINSRPTHKVLLDGTITTVQWRDLTVGDTVIIFGDDEIPADVVVLACGGVQGQTSYVETAAIDGETNLKLKNPCLFLDQQKKDAEIGNSDKLNNSDQSTKRKVTLSEDRQRVIGLEAFSPIITAEPPNSSIHRFNGNILLHRNDSNGSVVEESGKEAFTLSEKHLLLRGSVLRATEWCVGVVTYTGADTKLSLNSKKTPSKLSSVDRIVNKTLLIAITTMLFVCVISMVFSIVWEENNDNAKYLCLYKDDQSEKFTNGGGCESGSTNSYLTIFTFATLYNNFVCISMYVSLEMVYLCQSYFLGNDLKLYDETTDTPAECHTSGMCADLGQVQYVLCDKTGTLTKNCMVVKQFSVADKVYGEPVSIGFGGGDGGEGDSVAHAPTVASSTVTPSTRPSINSIFSNFTSSLHLPGVNRDQSNNITHEDILMNNQRPSSWRPSVTSNNSGGGGSGSTGPTYSPANNYTWYPLSHIVNHPASEPAVHPPRKSGRSQDEEISEDRVELEAELKLNFMRVLAYCNTAMLMPDSEGRVNITDADSLTASLQAESPDEVALILAAAKHCGILLTKRNSHEIECCGMNRYLNVNAESDNETQTAVADTERVELLAVNEFDSDRKMMSVLIRCEDRSGNDGGSGKRSKLMLLCKGADSSMLRNCQSDANPFTVTCSNHIDKFASTGLRTLVGACREVSSAEAEEWLATYRTAANSITERTKLLSACAKSIERNMTLLGAIGIEDELQDGVPEAIETLHSAGINVWMITGDKAETALAIGKKCNLIDTDRQEVQRVVNLTGEALRQRILDLHHHVIIRKQNQETLLRQSMRQRQSSVNNVSINGSESSSHRANSQVDPHSTGNANTAGGGDALETALMVDGISLEGLWASTDLKLRFVECIQAIPTVIACRVSPLQKAALVRMIKSSPASPITLAIGDGANDVGMIHAARVGVGISGKEGRHAANSADFAISQFRFIVTLMFEHGRYNYIRCSKLVLYSFFKNLLLVSVLFYYCLYAGFSGTVPIDTIVFSGYNFYLGLPVLALGALDFDVPREDVLRYPKLAYSTGRLGEMLNLKNMARWCIFAFIQGLLLFVVAMRFIGGPTFVNSGHGGEMSFDISGVGLNHVGTGWGLGMFPEGFLLYTCAVVSMQFKIVMMTTTPNIVFWTVWFLSYAGYFFFTYIYGLFPSVDWFNVVPLAFGQPQFWLALLLIPIVLSITDYTADVLWRAVDPSSRDLLTARLEADYKAAIIDGNSSRRSDGNGKEGVALRALSGGSNSSTPQDSLTRNPMNSVDGNSSSSSGKVDNKV